MNISKSRKKYLIVSEREKFCPVVLENKSTPKNIALFVTVQSNIFRSWLFSVVWWNNVFARWLFSQLRRKMRRFLKLTFFLKRWGKTKPISNNIIRREAFAQIISKRFTIKFQMKFVIWQWRMQVGSGCQIHFSEMKNLDLFTPFSSLTFTSEYSRMATYSTALGIFVWSPNIRLLDSYFPWFSPHIKGGLINENLRKYFNFSLKTTYN